ncbi:hypothetical protein NDU88_002434 [Pleurodeles waltl]|uniref:Uncharacterized protein n=1 Tax=Pleurodeles waltl TaxID=8319 RepID=A0AAV7W2D6_PLEWA|nr:hypothetical protein NDU88_002434 [Pleurodeles waltl]
MSNKYSVGVVRNDAVCEEGRDRVLALGDSVASHNDKPPRPTANFMIRGKGVQLMIDSGSLYTILPKKRFLQEWPAVSLLPKDISPGGYQGEKIDIMGYMWAKIEFGERHINGKVYIADSGPPILGWHHQYDLDIKIDPRAQENVMLPPFPCPRGTNEGKILTRAVGRVDVAGRGEDVAGEMRKGTDTNTEKEEDVNMEEEEQDRENQAGEEIRGRDG